MKPKQSSKLLGAMALAGLMALPVTAAAKEAGDLLIRLRGIGVVPEVSGTTDAVGGSADVSDRYTPELDFTYFFTDNIAAELILATTKHRVSVNNSTAGNLDLGTVRTIPPALTLQYHFQPDQMVSPYLGAGIQYIMIVDENPGASVTSVSYSDPFGFTLQGGVDIFFNDRWSLNLDVKKSFLSTDVKVNGGAINANNVDLDPWIFGVGIGVLVGG